MIAIEKQLTPPAAGGNGRACEAPLPARYNRDLAQVDTSRGDESAGGHGRFYKRVWNTPHDAASPNLYPGPIGLDATCHHSSTFQPIIILSMFRSSQVAVVVVFAEKASHAPASAESLGVAVARVRVNMAITQADTNGRQLRSSPRAWNRLVELAHPHIAATVIASGIPPAERDDCAQETWLEVFAAIHRIDPSEQRGSLHGWLSLVTRRTAWRFLHRQRRMAAFPLAEDVESSIPDRSLSDPAELCQQRETAAMLTELIDSLPVAVGSEVHLLIKRYLASDTPKLNTIAAELGITEGQLWHRWRKAITHFRRQLKSLDGSAL